MAMTAAQVRAYRQKMSGGKSSQDKDQSVETKTMTAEDVRAYRQKVQAQSEQKQKEANSVQGRMAQSQSGSGVRTATESPLQTRVQLPQGSTDTRWMGGGTRQLGTLDSKKLADEVLDSVLGTATGSPVKTDRQEDYEPDWNYAGGDNTPQQRAQAANAVKRDDFDRWNLWMDADTRHRELVDLMRQKEQNYTSYAQQGISASAPTVGTGGGAYTSYAQSGTSRSAGGEKETKAKYTDEQLRGMGYSQQEIDKARQYLTEYTAYNPAAVFVRRTADTTKGIAATVAAAPLLVGENLGVSIWNEMETRKNWKALREEVQGDTRQEKLLGMLTGGKTTYAQQGSTATSMQPYTDAELLEKGYTQAEIDTMRSRIAGTKVADSSDKDTLGYKLYDYGQRHTAAAQAGMSPAARTAMGVVSSAAENLAVAGVSPYLVLPVLSAQGAAESMGQSVEKGQSAGQTLATGLAKFGAGWAINSVGAADLAQSMGVDYAKDTLAGQIAGWVRGLGGDSAFKRNYPAVAAALSGGLDNAVQAFVETYADTAIDAVLGGDEEAAEALLKPETFVTALQSGLTGGASGALGGAVGTGLGAMSAQIDYKAQQAQAQQQAEQLAQEYRAMEKRALEPGESAAQVQRTAEQQEKTPSPLQFGDAGAATELPQGGSLSQRNETAVDDDPAKHTPAQNARIAEYKDSADLKLAEYVDRVRAGEQPAPYMVTETSDRMRDAMQQLTGLDKVGSVTMMDANAVRHITNRHGGGDGSADATMKESADVARAGYVLDNFDNAYLATRKAEGYFTSNGKRAPIVIFEKKIDGSHIIVEAVTDTKKSRNYIISEYLSSVGVPEKEIAKALRPPMDAAESDPRHTSETLNAVTSAIPIAEVLQSPVSAVADPEAHVRNVAADPSAATTVPQRDGQVNVEKAGESVESAQEYADVELHAEMEKLDTDSWTRTEQMDTARQLTRRAQMSEKAVQTVVDNMPQGIGAQIYAPAAASLYRLGIDGHAETFEAALQKTGKGGLSGGVQQVLALGDAGRTALNIAFLQGKGEAEHYREVKAAQLGQRPGKAALHDEAGIYYKADGSVSTGTKAEDAFIELSAKASGVAAQRVVKGLAKNAKGLLQSAAGRVFYSSEADAGTVMHETLHELNSWDSKGAQELIDRFEQYLVQQNGMDSVQQLVQGYLDRYANAGQKLTYNQAMEEITADAVRTIFGTEESFKTFLRVQAAEAKMNAQAQGRCERVMQKIETLLQKVLADIKTVLGREPDNAAARAAKTLTEQQLADLRELYLDHQIEAGANYRAALEANGGMEKAAAADAAAAEGRYSIDEGFEDEIEQLEQRSNDYMITVGKTSEVLKSIGVKDQTILWNAGKIKKILAKHSEANYKAGKDKSVMTADIIKQVPQVLEEPVVVLHSNEQSGANQGKNYGSRIYMFGEVTDALGQPVSVSLELLPTNTKGLEMDNIVITSSYGKNNVQSALNTDQLLYVDPNKKRTAAWLGSNGLQLPVPPTMYGSMGTLTYFGESVKMMDKNSRNAKLAQFMTQESESGNRYQLDVDAEDVEAARSQSVGDGGAQSQTVAKVMELAENAAVSDDSLLYIARKVAKAAGSKVDTKTLASRLAALRDYLNSGNVDWAEAHGFVLDMAQQIMEKSAKRNDALWKQYPELHEMGMSLEKGGKDYREVVYKYGSWAGATKELARHGIKLTLTKNGAVSRWDADFTELQGIGGGLLPAETPSSAADALEAMAAAHDAIRPTMESAYDTDWDAAKQEIGMQIWGEYLGLPGVANESNAALRRKFSQQTKEMNEEARKHALALQAQANLEAAKQRARNRQKMAKPYADATAKAKEHYAETEEKLREKLGTEERKMQQQAAVWREAERGRTREKVALEKAKNAQRLEKMRESRDKDYTRREIRKLAGELTKLYDHPKEGKYIPDHLVDKVLPVVQLANEAVGNREAAQRVAQWMHRDEKGYRYTPAQDTKAGMEKAVDGLRRGIKAEMEAGERANLEWEQSGLSDAIDNWLADVNQNREREIARVEATIRETQKWGDEYGGIDGTAMEAYLEALRTELNGYRNGGMAALSAEELRGLREILDQTVHIIKIDNVVVGAQEDAAIDEFAEGTKEELKEAGGVSRRNGWLGKLDRKFNIYRMNTMNIERMFERMGGYAHGGYMENLGRMLNDGQRKKTKILIEGTRIFDNVTGKAHERELYHFTHDLIDIGLVDEAGKTRRITHNQLAELYLQLQNRQGLHHILHGGITLDNMEAWVKGDSELAELDRETVRVGEMNLRDAEGKLLRAQDIAVDEDAARRNLLDEIDKNLTDFDRAWIEDYRKLNALMSGYINETSLLLSGVRKATTENYIHINVDQDTNPEQNKGIRYDNSVGNPGWLNHRVNSAKPVLLVGLVQQVNTSIENTAQYAGMAIPLRNAEKILNSMQDGKTLFTQIEKTWGKAGRAYLNKALADLCGVKDSREVGDGLFSRMRSKAAQAVLNANVNVTLLQAASLPTAAAELGWGSTGPAAVQFGKNVLPGELAKIEARMAEHGEELLQYRLRGTGHAELGSAGAQKAGLQRAHDAARNSYNAALRTAVHAADAAVSLWTGGITKMDEITVAALWAGCENYVKNHPAEFSEGAEVTDSKAYWAAVNEKFQRVVERTQPNYTTMQRTGMQRTTNEMAKFLMMFSTQRQQNAQIWTASVEDVIAQYDRYGNSKTEQAKAAKKEAWERFGNAATSQVFQTSVIAMLGVGVKFLLHRWKDLQDENGDMTKESIRDALLYDFCKSFMGNWVGGSEVMSVGEMIINHSFTSYDTISMTGISAINDLAEYIGRVSRLNAEDTSGMTEEELEKHAEKTKEAVADMLGQFAMLKGIPYTNLKKQVNAVDKWIDTFKNWNEEGGNFDSLPASATGQYDRLYNAYASGDSVEARAAVEKLTAMGKEDKIYSELKKRLKKYDPDVLEAAKAQNSGDTERREQLTRQIVQKVYEVMGIDPKAKADEARRAKVIGMVTSDKTGDEDTEGAINALADELLATERGHDKDAGIYVDLTMAAEKGSVEELQEEYDRLVKAGKRPGDVKSKITKVCKPEYVAGSEYDRAQLDEMLLALRDADNNPLYTQKTLDGWVSDAEKASAEPVSDPWADLR